MYLNYLDLENNQKLQKICQYHNINEFLNFIKSKKNFRNLNLQNCLYTACTNESDRKNEFIDLYINNQKIKKNLNFPHLSLCMISINNIELFQKFSKLFKITDEDKDQYLQKSIENENVNTLDYLLKLFKVDSSKLHYCLIKSCELGKLSIIKHLFINYDIDIHFNHDLAIRKAGSNNQIHVVKFLLTNNILKEKANPSAMDDDLLICAIMQENKELMDYLYNDYGMKDSKTVIDYKQFKKNLINNFKIKL